MSRATTARPRSVRPGKRRVWMFAVPLAVFLAFVAAMAWADPKVPTPTNGPSPKPPGSSATPQPGPDKPSPSPVPPTTPPTGPTWTPEPGLSPAPPDPGGKPVVDLGQPPKDGSDGLLQPFNVADRFGVPISAYTVESDTGDWDDIDLKIWNILAIIFFSIAKWVVGFACWFIKWALEFGLAGILVKPVEGIASTIRDQVINRLGLPGLFLTIAALFAGYQIMFRNRSRGFAEAGLSLVIAAVATTLLLSPAQVLLGTAKDLPQQGSTMLMSDGGVLGSAKDLSLQVSSLVLTKDPSKVQANPETVSKPIKDALVDALIVKPTQLMLYGRTFEGACAEAFGKFKVVQYNYNQMGLNMWEAGRASPGGGSTYLDQLTHAGKELDSTCKAGGVNLSAKKASADLAFSALFIAIAAVIIAVLLVLVTGGFLIAQGWVAFEAIRGHWALCVGILPGGGRATLWRWFSAIFRAILGVVLAVLSLAIFILIILALIDANTGKVLAVKFIAIDLTAIAGLAGHKKIKETARQVAVQVNRRLANAKIGGSRNSVFASPGRYAETAPSLKQVWNDAKGETRKVTAPIGKAGRTARDLWVGPPQRRGKGGKLRTAARIATNAAVVAGTGGTAAAAKVAAQGAAKQVLKKRLATAAVNRMSQTRGGRATMATGKAAAATAKYGWKAGKFAVYATAGAPVSVPRGVKAAKRGATAAGARTTKVYDDLLAAQKRAGARVSTKAAETKAFFKEGNDNLASGARYIGRQGAYIQLGLAKPMRPATDGAPPKPRAVASAPQVPGGPAAQASGITPRSAAATPAPGSAAAVPTGLAASSVETASEAPTTAKAPSKPVPPSDSGPGSTGPTAVPPRRIHRAARPAGPLAPSGPDGAVDEDPSDGE
ncbi:hypothetical protein ACWEQL_20215 [Kitasatospora sp. NPDC004240]